MSVALTGKDTIALGSRGLAPRIFADLADGDVAVLDFPNNLVEAKTGKNGNTIYAFNSTGVVATSTIRVLRGSADDKYLNAEMNRFKLDPPSYTLIDGEFIKRIGDGIANVTNDIYLLDGGIVQKMPNMKENVEGDTEQAVAVWQVVFANSDRSLS